jgi:hypothetical protein
MGKQIKGRVVGADDRDDDRDGPTLTQEQQANLRAQLSELYGTRMLTETQAAEKIGVVRETLQAWRYKKRYDLVYLKIGSLIRYREQDIAAFLERRLVKPEDATPPARARGTAGQPADAGRSRRAAKLPRGASLRRGRKTGELIA